MASTNRANRIAVLEDRIAELEELLGIDEKSTDPYRKLGLPPVARVMLGYLMKRELATRQGLYEAVYGARNDCDQPLDVKGAMSARIWTIRNALEPHGVRIATISGTGWSISAGDKKHLADVVAELPEDFRQQIHMKKQSAEYRRGFYKKGVPTL